MGNFVPPDLSDMNVFDLFAYGLYVIEFFPGLLVLYNMFKIELVYQVLMRTLGRYVLTEVDPGPGR